METRPETATPAPAVGFASGDLRDLLRALQAVRDGDFTVRLPGDWTGLEGKIADTFNEIVGANQKIAAERKDRKFKLRAYDTFPIRRWDKWLDDTQTHLFVVPSDGPASGPARDLLAGTRLVAQPGYGGPFGEGATEDLSPAFSPDGSSIVFAALIGLVFFRERFGPVRILASAVVVAGVLLLAL